MGGVVVPPHLQSSRESIKKLATHGVGFGRSASLCAKKPCARRKAMGVATPCTHIGHCGVGTHSA